MSIILNLMNSSKHISFFFRFVGFLMDNPWRFINVFTQCCENPDNLLGCPLYRFESSCVESILLKLVFHTLGAHRERPELSLVELGNIQSSCNLQLQTKSSFSNDKFHEISSNFTGTSVKLSVQYMWNLTVLLTFYNTAPSNLLEPNS